MQKKYFVYLFIVLLISVSIIFFIRERNGVSDVNKDVDITDTNQSLLLDGYPLEEVPLYELDSISSVKYFVNTDPNGFSTFAKKNFNYYNVVFDTKATQKEVLSYYRSLMDSVDEEYSSDTTVEGSIGKYMVSVNHWGSDDTVYLEVHLPESEFSKENRYFTDYPGIVDLKDDWVAYEQSFGKLAQNGGEIEHWEFFPVESGMEELMQEYIDMYSEKEDFLFDDDHGLTWKDGKYSVSMSFSEDHGRVYLMIREPLM